MKEKNKEILEHYKIYVSESGVPYIKGEEFFNSEEGRTMIKRAKKFGDKYVKKEKR